MCQGFRYYRARPWARQTWRTSHPGTSLSKHRADRSSWPSYSPQRSDALKAIPGQHLAASCVDFAMVHRMMPWKALSQFRDSRRTLWLLAVDRPSHHNRPATRGCGGGWASIVLLERRRLSCVPRSIGSERTPTVVRQTLVMGYGQCLRIDRSGSDRRPCPPRLSHQWSDGSCQAPPAGSGVDSRHGR